MDAVFPKRPWVGWMRRVGTVMAAALNEHFFRLMRSFDLSNPRIAGAI
jgi:hypothetical protein